MSWSLRPYITLDPEEAQLNEGGVNKWDNCGPAGVAIVMKWLGYGDPFEPQDFTNIIRYPTYHGPEYLWESLGFVQAHPKQYPNPPSTYATAGDILTQAAAAGSLGRPMIAMWKCNTNGAIVTVETGLRHFSEPIEDTGSELVVWNHMRGEEIPLPYASARAAYAGELTVFDRSLFPAPTPTPPSPSKFHEEDDMFVWLPTNKPTYVPVDAESARFGPGYAGRDIYIKLCHDRDFGGDTVLDVLFVPSDFETHQTLKDRKTVTLHGSSMQTLQAPDKWDGMVVIKPINGGTYYGAVKTEFRS